MIFWRSRYDSQLTLSAEEMLEISQKIRRKYAPSVSDSTPELAVLPIDPYHLHAYWNLVDKLGSEQHHSHDGQLTLRVFWHPNNNEQPSGSLASKLYFDVDLHSIQQQCRVQLPIDATAYSAAIGHRSADRHFAEIAHSNIVHIPRSRSTPPRGKKPAEILPAPAAQPFPPVAAKPLPPRADAPCYDEALIDLAIREKLSCSDDRPIPAVPKRVVKNDLSDSAAQPKSATLADSCDVYDEQRVDAMIQQTLHEKGIDDPLMPKSVPEAPPSDKSDIVADKTQSGRGNRQ